MGSIECVLNWQPLFLILRLAAIGLFIFVAYTLFNDPVQRTSTNWLLLLVAVLIQTQIYQKIYKHSGSSSKKKRKY